VCVCVQLLLLFLSVHSVVMLSSGARFPAPVLQTLQALQSAKVKLFTSGLLRKRSRPPAQSVHRDKGVSGRAGRRKEGRGAGNVDARGEEGEGVYAVQLEESSRLVGGREGGGKGEGGIIDGEQQGQGQMAMDVRSGAGCGVVAGGDGLRMDWVPSLSFVVEAPMSLRLRAGGAGGGADPSLIGRFERGLDAQVCFLLNPLSKRTAWLGSRQLHFPSLHLFNPYPQTRNSCPLLLSPPETANPNPQILSHKVWPAKTREISPCPSTFDLSHPFHLSPERCWRASLRT
jgi:hypothetical protein